jgi:phosphatidylethanolamine/phosphatidyl-N-methylethanolamine N-methyltransferase
MTEPTGGFGKTGPGPGAAALATINDDHVVAAYARWAPIYDWSFGAFTRSPCRAAVAGMNELPPSRILEIGVGTGISLPLYDRKHRVTGIDLSRDMLERAKKRVAEEGLSHVEGLEVMDASALTFPDAAFDAAMAMFVITVVPDPDKVLAEMARVVRPGGRVILVSHFSVESGPRAFVEKHLSRFSSRLGWRPNFPIETVLGRRELKLIARQAVKSFDLFTMLTFERV